MKDNSKEISCPYRMAVENDNEAKYRMHTCLECTHLNPTTGVCSLLTKWNDKRIAKGESHKNKLCPFFSDAMGYGFCKEDDCMLYDEDEKECIFLLIKKRIWDAPYPKAYLHGDEG